MSGLPVRCQAQYVYVRSNIGGSGCSFDVCATGDRQLRGLQNMTCKHRVSTALQDSAPSISVWLTETLPELSDSSPVPRHGQERSRT